MAVQADEPVPLCDENIFVIRDEQGDDNNCIGVGFACDLERRLRHASRLLATIRVDRMLDGPDGTLDPELLEQQLTELESTLTP